MRSSTCMEGVIAFDVLATCRALILWKVEPQKAHPQPSLFLPPSLPSLARGHLPCKNSPLVSAWLATHCNKARALHTRLLAWAVRVGGRAWGR